MNPSRLFCRLPQHGRTLLIPLSRLASWTQTRTKKTNNRQLQQCALKPNILACSDNETAGMVTEMIKKKVCEDPVPLLIMNPGTPFIIKELLKKENFTNMYVYETREEFLTDIENVLKMYDLEHRFIKQTVYCIFQEEVFAEADNVLPFSPIRKWNQEGPSFRIFGAHADFLFCLKLLLRICVLAYKHNLGSPEMLICVPKKSWNQASKITKLSGTNPSGVLYPIGYNTELLGYVSRHTFLPMKRSEFFSKKKIEEEDQIAVLSVSPVHHLSTIISIDDMPKLQFLAHQYMTGFAKMKYVIPELEKWIPGCGQNLVLAGLNVTDQFWSLTCEDFLTAVHTFISHPDFMSSTFTKDLLDSRHNEYLSSMHIKCKVK